MSQQSDLLVRDWRSGMYCLRVPVPPKPGATTTRQRYRMIPTGEMDRKRAKAVVAEYGADRLVHLAHAEAVTAKTIDVVTLGRNFTCRQIFDLWKDCLAERVATRTAESYGVHATSLFNGLDCWTKPLAWVSQRHLYDWMNDGEALRNTVMSRRTALISLYKFAIAKGVIVENRAEMVGIAHHKMSLRQLEPTPVRPFTEGQYLTLRAAEGVPQWWRDWITLSYCCGYRMIDCASMEWDSFSADYITVYPKKGRRAKRLAIPLRDPLIARPELVELIQRLTLNTERVDEVYIWPEHYSRIMGQNRVYYGPSFLAQLKRAGIPGGRLLGLTFHSLRRSCAVRLEEAGRTLEQIAKTLGHSNTGTTSIYVDSKNNLPAPEYCSAFG